MPVSQPGAQVADVVVDVDGAANASPLHGSPMGRIERVEVTGVIDPNPSGAVRPLSLSNAMAIRSEHLSQSHASRCAGGSSAVARISPDEYLAFEKSMKLSGTTLVGALGDDWNTLHPDVDGDSLKPIVHRDRAGATKRCTTSVTLYLRAPQISIQ